MSRTTQPTPRIVVGVNGSESSFEALRWALAEARLTGATVDAVTAWHPHPGTGTFAELQGRTIETGAAYSMLVPPMKGNVRAQDRLDDSGLEVADREDEAFKATHEQKPREALDRAVRDALREPGDPVKIVKRVVQGHTGEVLVRAAAGADMLVVGCRGHGKISEFLLGSVGRLCTHKSRCVVVVVPHHVHAAIPGAGPSRGAGRKAPEAVPAG